MFLFVLRLGLVAWLRPFRSGQKTILALLNDAIKVAAAATGIISFAIDSDPAMVVAKVLAMLSTFAGFIGFVLKIVGPSKKGKLKKAEPANDPLEMALVTDERPDSVAPSVRPTERSQETSHQGDGKGKAKEKFDFDNL